MMDAFDVILVDLQDLGCRIYTFVTTLRYVLEAAAQRRKAVWVLDRPNPVGRPVEGLALREGWESFVGAGPLPMRHGLTLGELGSWFVKKLRLDVEYRIIEMQGWQPDAAPGFGWPLGERAWVNPSPNAPNLFMARAYAGTVMVEGTTLSEGRGTTRPLELFGAPDIDACAVIKEMHALAPHWLRGCRLRDCWFEPTFHKHAGKLNSGVQIHTEGPDYGHAAFKPWRVQALAFKAIRCGAILLTSTNTAIAKSASSMAAHCCANGSTMRARRRRIWMRWPCRMRRRGCGSGRGCCGTEQT
jgi:uncharacterized protein YbbC (DUF1343 family)